MPDSSYLQPNYKEDFKSCDWQMYNIVKNNNIIIYLSVTCYLYFILYVTKYVLIFRHFKNFMVPVLKRCYKFLTLCCGNILTSTDTFNPFLIIFIPLHISSISKRNNLVIIFPSFGGFGVLYSPFLHSGPPLSSSS